MLEAKSLQQLAMQTIYKHQDEVNWNCLPEKLISLLGISIKQKRQMPSRGPCVVKHQNSTPIKQKDFDAHSKTLKSDFFLLFFFLFFLFFFLLQYMTSY